MAWIRLGHVYSCEEGADWRHSHAYVPTACVLADRVRVFVAFRDSENVGRTGYVDLDRRDPLRVIGVSQRPVLDVGPAGAFDDSGITPLSIVNNSGKLWLYYAGWHLSVSVRYHLFTGLAVSDDEGMTFRRHGNVPILDRTEQAWLLRSGVCVLKEGEVWKCWGATSNRLIDLNGKQIPTYDWSYLESSDGIHWPDKHRVVLKASPENGIVGFGRSHVLRDGGVYKAWLSIRTAAGYRIAYVQSADGIDWSPFDDERGLMPSGSGFDSAEVCFPSVFDMSGRRYMIYNGNDFGATGFGLAVWQE